MIIKNQIEDSLYNTSVALGLFDGIHLGHLSVISNMINNSNHTLIPTIFTFMDTYNSNKKCKQVDELITQSSKNKLLKNLGVKMLYQVKFASVSHMTPNEFVDNILCSTLKAKKVFCGFNYHFGYGGKADAEDLKTLCLKRNIEVNISDPILYNGNPISSTRIRKCIKDAKLEDVKNMLGRPFFIEGPVQNGQKIGRTISVPTINQTFEKGLIIPKFGVYLSNVIINEKNYFGITNIGTRPTVGGNFPNIETWLPDYNGQDLYDINVKIELIKYLREEKKFSSLNGLKTAILHDAQTARNIYNKL